MVKGATSTSSLKVTWGNSQDRGPVLASLGVRGLGVLGFGVWGLGFRVLGV